MLHDLVKFDGALVVQCALRQVLRAKLRDVHLAMSKLEREVVGRCVEHFCRGGELVQERVRAVALQTQVYKQICMPQA